MTLIVGLLTNEGIVLSSDSQATAQTTSQPTRFATQKLWLAGGVAAYGISGPTATAQLVREALDDHNDYDNLSRTRDTRNMLFKRIGEGVLTSQNQRAMAAVGNIDAAAAAVLFAGYAQSEPHLFEITHQGNCVNHSDPGYAAIGSGDIFTYHALASFSEFNVKTMSIDKGIILACRIVDDAIKVAAYGLGWPIQLAVIKPDGTKGKAKILSEDEVKRVRDDVSFWKGSEADLFRQLDSPAPGSSNDGS